MSLSNNVIIIRSVMIDLRRHKRGPQMAVTQSKWKDNELTQDPTQCQIIANTHISIPSSQQQRSRLDTKLGRVSIMMDRPASHPPHHIK